jgi:hypothetical protein
MAVTNPPGFLQNAGAVHTAEILRNSSNAGMVGARVAASLIPRGAVHPALGGALQVTQQTSPTMGITVATGQCFVAGTEGTSQGVYSCQAPTTTNLTISAANATLARRDLIIAQVQDTAYSGATNAWQLAVVTGTAAASPTDPAVPVDSLILARVNVAAAATSIVNANIADLRTYIGQGTIPIDIPANLPVPAFEGMMAYVMSNDSLYYYSGSAWIQSFALSTTPTVVTSTSATSAIGAIQSGFTMNDVRVATLLGGKLVEFDLYCQTPAFASGNIADTTAFIISAPYIPSHTIEVAFDQGTAGAFGVIDTSGNVTVRSTTGAWSSGNNLRCNATYIIG